MGFADQGVAIIGTDAVQLTEDSVYAQTILIRSLPENSDRIYWGNAGVTVDNGMILDPGEAVTIEIYDISRVWLIADAVDQEVRWIASSRR